MLGLKTVFIGIRESVFWKKNVLFSLLYLKMLPRTEIYVHEDDSTKQIDGFIGLNNDYIEGIFVKETMQSGRKGIFNGLESLTSNDEDSTFICREYDMIAAENLALHLKSEGLLSIVLPAKITFGGGRVKELREFLQSMYCIKEIADLPSGIFENTGVKTYLLTITTGRTDEVTIKRYSSDTENPRRDGINKLIVTDDTFVLEDELVDMGDWNIDRIFEAQDEDWIKFQESNIKKQELGTVATIFRGKAVNKKDPTGNIAVVNISNIGEYEIDYAGLDHLEEERKVSNYLLQDGDLLIPARGTAIRVAIFKEQPYPCIASSNVIVIRATDESLSTVFLKLFFDSPLGRKMLVSRQQGTAVMNISYKELNNIEIPLPSVEEQKAIAEEYTREFEVYKKSIQEAENRWGSTLARLQERI